FPLPGELGPTTDSVIQGEFRRLLVDALGRVKGFIFFLDCLDVSRALVMFESFPSFMAETGLSDLPCERVCICLTKADSKFADRGGEARDAIENAAARDHVEGL